MQASCGRQLPSTTDAMSRCPSSVRRAIVLLSAGTSVGSVVVSDSLTTVSGLMDFWDFWIVVGDFSVETFLGRGLWFTRLSDPFAPPESQSALSIWGDFPPSEFVVLLRVLAEYFSVVNVATATPSFALRGASVTPSP